MFSIVLLNNKGKENQFTYRKWRKSQEEKEKETKGMSKGVKKKK